MNGGGCLEIHVSLHVAANFILDVTLDFARGFTRRAPVAKTAEPTTVLSRSLALWLSDEGAGRSSVTGAGAALVLWCFHSRRWRCLHFQC